MTRKCRRALQTTTDYRERKYACGAGCGPGYGVQPRSQGPLSSSRKRERTLGTRVVGFFVKLGGLIAVIKVNFFLIVRGAISCLEC